MLIAYKLKGQTRVNVIHVNPTEYVSDMLSRHDPDREYRIELCGVRLTSAEQAEIESEEQS